MAAFFNGTARGKGDVIAKTKRKQERRELRRIERKGRRAEREEAGISGPDIDWSLAVASTVDTPVEGVAKTLARGG